ncbi:MAG: hypothetical protein ABIN80_07915 [Dyadobacter sp.]|uniref:hypothetical protein n=1 Tax=Dyadobacter sp. TaxID=1914288 RepID=UPI003267D680
MRYLIIIFCLTAFNRYASGSERSLSAPFYQVKSVQGKVSVRPEDLPEAVKTTLAGNMYADWKITSAYLVTRDDNSQYYEINIKKEAETAVVNLDKYGKKID